METMYEISENTLAVLSTRDYKAMIIEKDGEYIYDTAPYQVMDNSCQYFGSSYSGRQEGSRKILGVSYKAPIIVEETRRLIFFPTVSPSQNDCCWISLKEIRDYYPNPDKTVTVIFHSGKKISLPVSYYSFENQVLRAARLDSILYNRMMSS